MIIYPYSTWIMSHPPVIPKLYFGAISQEQRLLEMCKKIRSVEDYLVYLSDVVVNLSDDIQAEVEQIIAEAEADIQASIEELRSYTDAELEALRDWVYRQTLSMQQWDVTRGLATDSVDAARRTFFDVTIFGTTVDALAASELYTTVDALATSGWNVRALAVIGARVLDHLADMSPWVPTGGGQPTGDAFDAEALSIATIDSDGFVVVNP